MKKTFLLIAVIFVISACNIKIKSNAVNAYEYLTPKENSKNIYKKTTDTKWINPFNFSHTDFGRLILVSIDKHPKIKTVELVVQNDNKGAFVVVYYQNGKVETYPNLVLSINKKYLRPNSDWTVMKEREFDYQFEKTEKGLKYKLSITIKDDTHIDISVKNYSVQTKQYSFLAAIGADLREVKRFPLIYLRQAGFLPLEKTEISFKINSVVMKPTEVPIKVENKSCYKTVYSFSPQAFFWNEEQDTVLNYLKSEKKNYQFKNPEFLTVTNNKRTEIKKIIYKIKNHSAKYNFMPFFPDIYSLKDELSLKGKFTIDVDEIEGVIGGIYQITKQKNEIEVIFKPKKCWQPMPGKDWVSSYIYKAKIKAINNHQYSIKSKWIIN
jgi:hypothetical protein